MLKVVEPLDQEELKKIKNQRKLEKINSPRAQVKTEAL